MPLEHFGQVLAVGSGFKKSLVVAEKGPKTKQL